MVTMMTKEQEFITWLSGVIDGATTPMGISDEVVKKIEDRIKEFDFIEENNDGIESKSGFHTTYSNQQLLKD